MPANVGIYKITNMANGNIYIGQSVNLTHRATSHLSDLRLNKHYNDHIQKAYNLYGKDNFKFDVILFCEPKELTYYEQVLVDKLSPSYNICKECVDSIKGVLVGRALPEEHRLNISKAQTGKRHPVAQTEEAKLNRSKAQLGKHLSEEHKQKLSAHFSGLPWTDARKQHPITDEAKIKISNTLKGRPWTDKRRSHTVSEETKLKTSKTLTETLSKKRLLVMEQNNG